MVEFANKKGIDLSKHFKTPEDFKVFVTGFAIKMLFDNGIEVEKAMDFILGNGSYQQIAEDAWNRANSACTTAANG